MVKIKSEEFNMIASFIKSHSGIHLKPEKKTLLIGRLTGLLNELEISCFTEFYEKLKSESDGKLLSQVIDRITTNHTYFMRESEHFTFLQTEVLPYLKESVRNRDLRIWCAASSTGEEPYTLAMLLEDFFGQDRLKWDKKLLATDISTNVLQIAKEGIYSKDKVQSIPKLWQLNYFSKVSKEAYQINAKVRNQVIYRRFNLLEKQFPFRQKFHVIFCRNVMIYFDNDTKTQLINKFYDCLEPGGYLFVGHSESVDRRLTKFKYIQPAVYRKI